MRAAAGLGQIFRAIRLTSRIARIADSFTLADPETDFTSSLAPPIVRPTIGRHVPGTESTAVLEARSTARRAAFYQRMSVQSAVALILQNTPVAPSRTMPDRPTPHALPQPAQAFGKPTMSAQRPRIGCMRRQRRRIDRDRHHHLRLEHVPPKPRHPLPGETQTATPATPGIAAQRHRVTRALIHDRMQAAPRSSPTRRNGFLATPRQTFRRHVFGHPIAQPRIPHQVVGSGQAIGPVTIPQRTAST